MNGAKWDCFWRIDRKYLFWEIYSTVPLWGKFIVDKCNLQLNKTPFSRPESGQEL